MLIDTAIGSGIVYGAEPLRGMAEFEVQLLDYAFSLRGSLKFGIMRHKIPTSAAGIPKLSEHRNNSCMWFRSRFKEKTEFQNNLGRIHLLRFYGSVDLCELKENDCIGLQVRTNGDLVFLVNGVSQGVAAHHVYKEGYQVYCFLELVEGYKSVEVTRAGT